MKNRTVPFLYYRHWEGYKRIAEYNKIPHNGIIYPGDILKIPLEKEEQ